MTDRAPARQAFTLIELMVSVAIIAALISMLAPALASARGSGQTVRCRSNLRQLGLAWTLYADAADGRVLPLAYTQEPDIQPGGDPVYFYGRESFAQRRVIHQDGLLAPYLDSTIDAAGVFECPSQPADTYRPQGVGGSLTTTYGYNGYYLSPGKTPGWGAAGYGPIRNQAWQRLYSIERPSSLLVFADTLMWMGGPRNTALLDPPMLFDGRGNWSRNNSPTTAFRHVGGGNGSVAAALHADGSVRMHHADAEFIVSMSDITIGSICATNDPGYVPNWRSWR